MSDAIEFAVQDENGLTRIQVSGVVDLQTAPELLEYVQSHDGHRGEDIVLDLADVSFMESSGLVALLKVYELLGERLRITAGPALEPLILVSQARSFLPLDEPMDLDRYGT